MLFSKFIFLIILLLSHLSSLHHTSLRVSYLIYDILYSHYSSAFRNIHILSTSSKVLPALDSNRTLAAFPSVVAPLIFCFLWLQLSTLSQHLLQLFLSSLNCFGFFIIFCLNFCVHLPHLVIPFIIINFQLLLEHHK